MRGRSDRLVFAVAAAVLLLACGADPARAHAPDIVPGVPSLVASPVVQVDGEAVIAAVAPDIALPLTLVAGLVLSAAAALARLPRRTVVVAVVPLWLLIGFETGVHGVHHLGDARAAAQCSVAVTTEHLAGATAEAPVDPGVALLASSVVQSVRVAGAAR